MRLFIIGLLLLLVGCKSTEQQAVASMDLTKVKGFEDCVWARIDPGGAWSVVSVIRCPNSSTSTTIPQQGKIPAKTAIVIDGVEYIKKD